MNYELELKAFRREPLPEGLDIADSFLYEMIRLLSIAKCKKLITKEQAAEEKQTAIYNATQIKSKIDFISRQAANLADKIAKASEEYKHTPTIENADKLYAAFYNLPDDWRKNYDR